MKYVVVVAIFMAFAILVFVAVGHQSPTVRDARVTSFTCPPEKVATREPEMAPADPEY